MDQKIAAEIVARVLKGDRKAYALLVEEYKSPIYNLAYRMTGNLEDADDLTQETFIRAYQYLRRYDPRKKFFTWLYTIALNLIKND
jgi:RNA polymerase sigma-70 factor (ECF subfamily)